MANPNGNLAGWSGKSVPGWQAEMLDASAKSRTQKKRKRERTSGMYLFFDEPFRELLHLAAKRRGLSITGYGRRAVAAFIAKDLGLRFSEVVHHSAHPAPYGNLGGRQAKSTHDSGEGYGEWEL